MYLPVTDSHSAYREHRSVAAYHISPYIPSGETTKERTSHTRHVISNALERWFSSTLSSLEENESSKCQRKQILLGTTN